jgi:N,N'-diacetyllegionaminate synthase
MTLIRIIAEIGSVHDGSFGNACKLIEAAAKAGADTVKFQTHIAEAESLPSAPSPAFFSSESRMEYFDRTGFSEKNWVRLADHAKENGVTFLSSPFSIEAVELLERVNVSAYKIPSGEVNNIPLLERVAETKKPILLSSGMSSWDELDQAVSILRNGGKLTIMQCSSIYPCPLEKVGLNVLKEMRERYNIPVGYSDHTTGFSAPIAAAALGAQVIEKHFTFSKQMYGSDAPHSMEPNDFSVLCTALKETWKALENPVDKSNTAEFSEMKRVFEKSIVSKVAIPAGTIIERQHLAFKKPGDGIKSFRYKEIIGRQAKVSIEENTMIREEQLK